MCMYTEPFICMTFSRKEKEIRKALETPEEKRARRLAKKEAKERKRRQNLGWDSEQLVDNDPCHDNPQFIMYIGIH